MSLDALWAFLSLSDINTRYVVIGSILLASSTALVGCFTMLRHRSLLGDAIAHAVLPGICLAFWLTETKNPLVLLIGSFVSGWLSLVCIDWLAKHTRLKEDTIIASMLSLFFALGIVFLTAIQQTGLASQSGLDKYLFGQAASLIGTDLWVFGTVGLVLILSILLFYKEFKLLSFDPAFARVQGLPVDKLELLMTSLTVAAVVVGIQAVGVVMMAAMLITPAAAARFFTNRLPLMMALAAGFGAISGLAGAFISYTAPGMPTGPWIVMVVSIIALASFFFAPGKGIIYQWVKRRQLQEKILLENTLKLLYHLGESKGHLQAAHTLDELLAYRAMEPEVLQKALASLRKKFHVRADNNTWSLTSTGLEQGKRVVKLHRLWELYLSRYLNLPDDHIHDDAEAMEHIITPKLEAWLEQQLQYPDQDPHGEAIPY